MSSTDVQYIEYRSTPDIFGEDRWIVGQIRTAEVRDGVTWYQVEPLAPLPTERVPRWVTAGHLRAWEQHAAAARPHWRPLMAL